MSNNSVMSPLRYAVIVIGALCLNAALWSGVYSQIQNPGAQIAGAAVAGHCVTMGPGVGQIQDAGAACATQSVGANPTGTAGPAAVNGVATTFMRSDAAPAVQKGTNAQFGIIESDGTTLVCTAGVCVVQAITVGGQSFSPGGSAAVQGNGAKIQLATGAAGANGNCLKYDASGNAVDNGAACATQSVGANPTGTAGPAAVNGAATTFMRSDAAPAVQKGTNAQFGIIESDGTTLVCTAGVCVVQSITVGGQSFSPGGSAAVQGNGAKIQLSTGTTTLNDCVKFDTNGNTVDNGAPCAGAAGANPSATASNTAVNGVATTFMRSDAAPAVQLASNAQFGLAEGDNVGVTCASGVCGQKATFFANSLGADVALSSASTFFDGPSTAQGTSGTWEAFGTVTLVDTGAAAAFICKLWDGTTVIAATRQATAAANSYSTLSLSGIITSPASNIKISCENITDTTGKIIFNISGTSKDSTVTVHRIQ